MSLSNINRLNSSEVYPLVYLPSVESRVADTLKPEAISNDVIIKEYSIKYPEIPVEPKKPNPPSSLNTPYKYSYFKDNFRLILMIFIIVIIGSVLLLLNDDLANDNLNWLYLLIMAGVLLFIVIRIATKNYIQAPIDGNEKLRIEREYQNDLNKHETELLRYSERMKVYKESLESIEVRIGNLKAEYKGKQLRMGYFEAIKAKSYPHRSNELVLKGRTEKAFLRHLFSRFSSSIMIDMELKTHGSAYYPDYVYKIEDLGVYIDIEIDEQYDLETKKPIHYIGGDDDKRNDFFLGKNWFIVRFAEQQIKKYPEECCDFIEYIVRSIRNPQYISEFKFKMPRIKRWTYEESFLDADSNKRDT